MFVHLSSASFFSSTIELIKRDRLQVVVNYIAVGILFAGISYFIWSYFWHNRRVEVKDFSEISPISKSTQIVKEKFFKPSVNFGVSKKEIVDDDLLDSNSEGEDHDNIKETDLPPKMNASAESQTPEEDFHYSDDEEVEDISLRPVYDYVSGILGDYSPLMSSIKFPIPNEDDYENMFTSIESVPNTLKDYEYKDKHDWVCFCNSAFINHHLTTNQKETRWTLYISIDPAQRYEAWRIIAEEVNSSHLCIYGKIHSTTSSKTNQCPVGEAITLFILKEEENNPEWQQFLSLIANRFIETGICLDPRSSNEPINSDHINCGKGVPAYFSCKSNSSKCIDKHPFAKLTIERM